MARAEARAVIAVEVFVEQDQVAPVRIGLEFLRATVDRTPALLVAQEDRGEAPRDLAGDPEQVHLHARAAWALDGKARSVERVQVEQRPDEEQVDREPDRPAPVR